MTTMIIQSVSLILNIILIIIVFKWKLDIDNLVDKRSSEIQRKYNDLEIKYRSLIKEIRITDEQCRELCTLFSQSRLADECFMNRGPAYLYTSQCEIHNHIVKNVVPVRIKEWFGVESFRDVPKYDFERIKNKLLENKR